MVAPRAARHCRGVREPSRVLGQLLVAAGSINSEQLASALREQQRTRARLGDILIRAGIDPACIAEALAQQLKLSFVAAPLTPRPEALAIIDRQIAARLRIVPLSLREKTVCVAMADPLDMHAIDDLQFRTGRRVEPVVATVQAVTQALVAYDATEIATLLQRIPAGAAVTNSEDELRRASEAPPIVALLDHILARAADVGASDVHVEPRENRMLIRARVDGVLRELLTLPPHVAAALTSRIKVTANLDISIRRKPQDGRCNFHCNGEDMAARVSTLPSHYGEKIVMRVLRSSSELTALGALGMSDDMLAKFRVMLKRSHGVLLVTGPTGSGKTSTLYAALCEMDARGRNIITLEDPIERRIEGTTQVQVNRRGGTTFARALRAVLRQDPDIILVGELRDRETVETALAAALTGHLVLTTLHTNDAASAATRLIEMGAPPYLICGALIGVLAQRLVRRLCGNCMGRGCASCGQVGYRGRVGVFELLGFNTQMRELVMHRAPADRLAAAAQAAGATMLNDDALSKVAAGITSLDEVRPMLSLVDVDVE